MSTRVFYLAQFTLITALLLVSIYLQYFQGMQPCPLCTLQRITFIALGFLFLIGIFLTRMFLARMIISALAVLFSLIGIGLSGRQIWLQNYPNASSNECGVDLQYLLQVLPVHEAMQKVFAGSTECTERGWEFLYLNMAEWSLLWFILFFLLSAYLFLREFKW